MNNCQIVYSRQGRRNKCGSLLFSKDKLLYSFLAHLSQVYYLMSSNSTENIFSTRKSSISLPFFGRWKIKFEVDKEKQP